MAFEDQPDEWIIQLYREWSEETWAAGFMGPSPSVVKQFYAWVDALPLQPREDYEQEMIDIFRKIDRGEVI